MTQVQQLSQAMNDLISKIKSLGVATAATSAVLGATLVRSAKMFSPAEAIRFEYRMRDLSAVIGSVLHPTFVKLSDTVYALSKWLLNLSDSTKKWINTIAQWLIPATALGLAFSGMGVVIGGLITAGGILISTFSWLAKVVGITATKQAVTAASTTAVMNVTAGVVNVAGGVGSNIMGGTTQGTVLHTFKGKPAPSMWSKGFGGLGGGLAAAGGLAATAVAGGHSFGEDMAMAGSTALMTGITSGNPLAGLVAGLGSLFISQIKGWWMGTGKPAAVKGELDPVGMAPRNIENFSSVLDPGRKLRMNALTTGGQPEADASTLQAAANQTLKLINDGQNRVIAIWEEWGRVVQQEAQNRLAR